MRLNTILAFMLGAALMAAGSVLIATWPKFQTELCRPTMAASVGLPKPITAQDLGWDQIEDTGNGLTVSYGRHKWLIDSGFMPLSPACEKIFLKEDGYVCSYYGEEVTLGSDAKFASFDDELRYFKATVRSNSGVYHLPPKPAEK